MTSLRTCDGAGPSSRGTTGPEGTEGGAFDASKAVKEREDWKKNKTKHHLMWGEIGSSLRSRGVMVVKSLSAPLQVSTKH